MDEKNHTLNQLMNAAMDKVRLMADANTVVGEPIVAGEVTLIPISRVSIGVGVGGSDFVSKNQKRPEADSCFGGGTGAGMNIDPISRVSIGVGVGGSDFVSKNQKRPEADSCFGGGTGAGMNIDPIAFLVVRGDTVRVLPMLPPADGALGRVVDMVPELVDKVTDFVEKQQEKKDNAGF